ncbi:helix-turn-helix domain-containing protein [Azospirillum sp. 11R-A]|uniref:helix-turn-helix domain-containing protein n=1 Tax=Azospirillum sp. 11R-A TaxID=3111634 RepID=UPI003C2A1636
MLATADRRPARELDETTEAPEHRRLAEDALWALTQAAPGAHLPVLARAMRAWIVDDRPRGAVRAALPAALQATGVTRALLPILAGADTLRPDSPLDPDGWTLAFARSLEREATDGLAILRRLEHAWREARAAIGPRRSNSRLPAAVDLLAATPLLGPARMAALLGCSVRGAGLMMEELVACGAAVEVTGRGSHRLYGLPATEGIRGETAGPRRYGHRRGRPPKVIVPEPLAVTEPLPPPPPVPARLERLEVDYTALDALLADTNRVVERVQRLLKSR